MYEGKDDKEVLTTVNQDHTDAVDTDNLERKHEECRKRIEEVKQQLSNTKRREKRSKGNLRSIIQELKEIRQFRQFSEEAQQMLDSYKGKTKYQRTYTHARALEGTEQCSEHVNGARAHTHN